MTARQVWEGMLVELSKVNAPSLLLQDFNYFFNKAINQYINKRYNIYDVNQQTTDDLRVLKSEARIKVGEENRTNDPVFGATYFINLPDDYLHLLNCVCIYTLAKNNKCFDKGNQIPYKATRLTGDTWSSIINDYYNRPLPERPYYYIHNVNNSSELPTNAPDIDMYAAYNVGTNGEDNIHPQGGLIADSNGKKPGEEGYIETRSTAQSNFPRTISLKNGNSTRVISTIEREAAQRYGNASKVRCEIRYGYDDSVYQLTEVRIDYIKTPQTIRLTKQQVDLTEDTSQIMEFPDYVCQEIINELVTLVMENIADPRLQTHSAVTQSIANPAQQQTQQPQPQPRGS